MQYTAVSCALLALAVLVLISACSREQVVVERDTRRETRPPTPAVSPTPEVSVRQPPPPPRAEVRPPQPSPTHVWIPGYWIWDNGWVWIQGRWERPPERAVTWVPGQWVQRSGVWVWRSGYWE